MTLTSSSLAVENSFQHLCGDRDAPGENDQTGWLFEIKL